MPFAFTMKHYQIFGESTANMKDQALVSEEAWDVLRENHPFFSIADTREEWLKAAELEIEKDGQDKHVSKRADDTVQLLKEKGMTRLFSIGSGGGALEYQIKKRMPEVTIVCSDYSPTTVERLKKVFTECEDVITYDALTGDYAMVQERYIKEHGLCMVYRIDASFSDTEWTRVFDAMAKASIQNVLIIPTGTLTMLSVYNRKKREFGWALRRIPVVFCGYLRTTRRFKEQWSRVYSSREAVFGGLVGFILERKNRS